MGVSYSIQREMPTGEKVEVAPEVGSQIANSKDIKVDMQDALLNNALKAQADGILAYKDHPNGRLPTVEKLVAEGKPFQVLKGNIGRFFLITREGFIKVPGLDKPFSIVRYAEGGQRVSIAVFRVPIKKKFGKAWDLREVPINDALGIPTNTGGWEMQFDATTYLQIVVSHDKVIQNKMLDITKEFTQQMESINAITVVRKDFLQKKKKWWQMHPEMLFMVGAMFIWLVFMLVGEYWVMSQTVGQITTSQSSFITQWGNLANKLLGSGVTP